MPVIDEKQNLAKKSDLLTKQDILTPGTGITIQNNVISATGTGGSTVTVTPVLSTGTRIAAMEVDGTIYTLFAPTPPSVGVTQVVNQGVELARVTINGVATSIYAPEGSTVLSGTSAPTAAQGENNNLYVQYVDNSGTLSVVATYVKLNGSWVELTAGGGSSVTPNPQGTSVGVLNSISIDGDKYSIHPENWEVTEQYIRGKYDPLNEFGWYAANQTYYIDSKISWVACSNNFTKTNNKPALGAVYMLNNGNYYTMLVSTDSSATAFTGDKTNALYTTTIDGVTWYFSATNQAIYTWGSGVSGMPYIGHVSDLYGTAAYIVQQSQISTDHPYRNKTVQMSPPAATGYLFGGGGLQNDLSDATFKVTAAGTVDAHGYLIDGQPLSAGNVDDVYVNGTSVLDSNKIAQIKSYKEVTQAQYDALPDTKLSDGILYCITDKATADTTVAPIIYSTDEREIGVWTDGKPLYQKTYTITTDIGSSAYDIDSTFVPSAYTLCKSECNYMKMGGGYAGTIFSGETVTNNAAMRIIQSETRGLHCSIDGFGSGYYSDETVITVYYTKAADTPGSGKYAPSGVPTVHYSTDEQVVGTWIDGSTLYEQTIYVENPTKNSTSGYYYYNVFSTATNIDFATLLNATIYDTTDGRWLDLPYERMISSEAIHIQGMVVNHSYQFQVFFPTSQSYNITKMVATIRYTKTTS